MYEGGVGEAGWGKRHGIEVCRVGVVGTGNVIQAVG